MTKTQMKSLWRVVKKRKRIMGLMMKSNKRKLRSCLLTMPLKIATEMKGKLNNNSSRQITIRITP